jgi:hypothetical protein
MTQFETVAAYRPSWPGGVDIKRRRAGVVAQEISVDPPPRLRGMVKPDVAFNELLRATCRYAKDSPPQLRRGGRDIEKYRAATFNGADGVVLVQKSILSGPSPNDRRGSHAAGS